MKPFRPCGEFQRQVGQSLPCILIVILITWNATQILDGRKLDKASNANDVIMMAYHLYKHNTYSKSKQEHEFEPTAIREPAHPTYFALFFAMNNKLRNMSINTIFSGGEGLKILRYAQLPILILTSLLTMYLTLAVTKKIVYGYLALLMTGFSSSLLISLISMETEPFAALLVLCTSVALYKVLTKKSKKYFALLGFVLGLLVLTEAIYMYFIIFVLVSLIYFTKAGLFNSKQLITGIIILVATYSLLVGSWLVRNYMHFGSFYMTGRGGVVLAIRSKYNMMSTKEFWGSFLDWTPDSYARKKLREKYGNNALNAGGELERLNLRNPNGYYQLGRAVRDRIGDECPQIDLEVRSTAFSEILKHPFRHILTTLPLGWRGLFVESGYMLFRPFSMRVISSVGVSIIYFVFLFIAVFLYVRKKMWQLLVITFPAIYLYGLNSFITHNLPRYNQPLIPVLVVVLLLVIHFFRNEKMKAIKGRKPSFRKTCKRNR